MLKLDYSGNCYILENSGKCLKLEYKENTLDDTTVENVTSGWNTVENSHIGTLWKMPLWEYSGKYF